MIKTSTLESKNFEIFFKNIWKMKKKEIQIRDASIPPPPGALMFNTGSTYVVHTVQAAPGTTNAARIYSDLHDFRTALCLTVDEFYPTQFWSTIPPHCILLRDNNTISLRLFSLQPWWRNLGCFLILTEFKIFVSLMKFNNYKIYRILWIRYTCVGRFG